MAVHGTRRGESVTWDYEGLLQLLGGLARERTGLPLLRCYWYEATVDGRRTAEQDALADLPGIKLRVAKIRPGRREGVETEIHRDLTTLARNNAITDALVISAEEDLAQVIADVQDLGLRVTLVHIAVDGNWTISRALRQESDDIIEIGGEQLRPYVELIAGAEPVRADEPEDADRVPGRTLANGHAPAASAGSYQPPPAGTATTPRPPSTPRPWSRSTSGPRCSCPARPAGTTGPGRTARVRTAPATTGPATTGPRATTGPATTGPRATTGPARTGRFRPSTARRSRRGGRTSTPRPPRPPGGAARTGRTPEAPNRPDRPRVVEDAPGYPPVQPGVPEAVPGIPGLAGVSRPGRDGHPPVSPRAAARAAGAGARGQGPMGPVGPLGPAGGTPPSGQHIGLGQGSARSAPYSGPQPVVTSAPPGYASGGVSLSEAVQAAHEEGQEFGASVARDAPALWLEAVLARKPRMPSDLEARLLQGSALPIDFLLHDEVRHALRRGFWDALERTRR